MGFLNNSGDIVLDAVLTDTGRARLSKGDGSFRITKFALADDEIDYSLYNSNTGSAYVDLQILQTPVLESFTNNASSVKNKLLTINLNNILYLPVLKVNNISTPYANKFITNGYIVAVDRETETYLAASGKVNAGAGPTGVLKGYTVANSNLIRVDQGLDTTALQNSTIDSNLLETQYTIEMDNRVAILTNPEHAQLSPSYIDDDDIASYMVSDTTNPTSVTRNTTSIETQNGEVIRGPRGTILKFGLEASLSAKTSNFLFQTIGSRYTGTLNAAPSSGNLYTISSNIIVTGMTTGYSITVPVVYVKIVV